MAKTYMTGTQAAAMSYEDLKKAVKPILKEARQRASRMMKSEKIKMSDSPALRAAMESRPTGQISLFEAKGKNRNQLLMEYIRAKTFLESKTSTVKGTTSYLKEVTKKINESIEGTDLDVDETKTMLEVFDKLKKEESWVTNQLFKYDIFEAINYEKELITAENEQRIKDGQKLIKMDPDTLADRILNLTDENGLSRLDKIYLTNLNGKTYNPVR